MSISFLNGKTYYFEDVSLSQMILYIIVIKTNTPEGVSEGFL